jgi:hypothetical protein
MSRWSKNRFGQTIAVSLEKENNNKPGSGSRTVGTIGKWGNLEFTSIRSSIISKFRKDVWIFLKTETNELTLN